MKNHFETAITNFLLDRALPTAQTNSVKGANAIHPTIGKTYVYTAREPSSNSRKVFHICARAHTCDQVAAALDKIFLGNNLTLAVDGVATSVTLFWENRVVDQVRRLTALPVSIDRHCLELFLESQGFIGVCIAAVGNKIKLAGTFDITFKAGQSPPPALVIEDEAGEESHYPLEPINHFQKDTIHTACWRPADRTGKIQTIHMVPSTQPLPPRPRAPATPPKKPTPNGPANPRST